MVCIESGGGAISWILVADSRQRRHYAAGIMSAHVRSPPNAAAATYTHFSLVRCHLCKDVLSLSVCSKSHHIFISRRAQIPWKRPHFQRTLSLSLVSLEKQVKAVAAAYPEEERIFALAIIHKKWLPSLGCFLSKRSESQCE